MTAALLIKMSSLGDVIHALPAVTDAALAGVTFDWVVEEAFAPIAARHPAVRTVLPIAWRRWRRRLWDSRDELRTFHGRLREQPYDLILDAQGLAKSWVVGRLANGSQRAGFAADSARERIAALGLHHPVHIARTLHAIDRQRQLFAATFGYEVPDRLVYGIGGQTSPAEVSLNAQSTAPSADKTCLLLHGTTWHSKLYPEAHWETLIGLARDDGFSVAVTWGDDAERARAERLSRHGAIIWPKQSLAELVEHMSTVSLVVGVDSGLTHLAAALDLPTVALFGPTDPVLTGVRGRRAVSLAVDFTCAPCRRATCARLPRFSDKASNDGSPCFATLGPEQVWRAACHQLTLA